MVLGSDAMHVNESPFSLTVSSQIEFVTVEHIAKANTDKSLECFGSIAASHDSQGFRTAHLPGDTQFNCSADDLSNEHDVKFNDSSANEHVPETERMIGAVKKGLEH